MRGKSFVFVLRLFFFKWKMVAWLRDAGSIPTSHLIRMLVYLNTKHVQICISSQRKTRPSAKLVQTQTSPKCKTLSNPKLVRMQSSFEWEVWKLATLEYRTNSNQVIKVWKSTENRSSEFWCLLRVIASSVPYSRYTVPIWQRSVELANNTFTGSICIDSWDVFRYVDPLNL